MVKKWPMSRSKWSSRGFVGGVSCDLALIRGFNLRGCFKPVYLLCNIMISQTLGIVRRSDVGDGIQFIT